MRNNKSYSELMMLETFEERYGYLKLAGIVGIPTFGSNRYLNQILYGSQAWKEIRDAVIVRDHGFDLGVEDVRISGYIVVHHINPITVEDILNRHSCVFDMENLITTSGKYTHKAIHYGDKALLPHLKPIMRMKNDTSPWLKQGGYNE